MRSKGIRTRESAGRGRTFVLVAEILLFVLVIFPALAQVGNGYDLSWSTIDAGGGTTSVGGSYSLGGTFGQPDAGWANGGVYGLATGFWSVTAAIPSVKGHLVWQGRPTQPSALQQLPLTLTLRMDDVEPITYADASLRTDASGYFTVSVGGLPHGTYNWRVKGLRYLATSGTLSFEGLQVGAFERSEISNVQTFKRSNVQTIEIEVGELKVGDASDDNVIDIADFNLLKGSFGLSDGMPNYNSMADFNGDDTIDIVDFNLLKGNFGQSGTDPLAPSRH